MTHFLSDIAFLGRQYNALVASGLSSQQAISTLDLTLADRKKQAFSIWRHLIDAKGHSLTGMETHSLINVLCKIKENHGDLRPVPDILETGLSAIAPQSDSIWRDFTSAISYSMSILLIGIVCWSVYFFKVYPVFHDIFHSMGMQLPAFTQKLSNFVGEHGLLLSLVLSVSILSYLLCMAILHRRIQQLTPIPLLIRWLPGCSGIVRLHHQNILLLSACLIDASLDEEQPLSLASKWLGVRIKNPLGARDLQWENLLLAEELGNTRKEINHWFSLQGAPVERELKRFTRQFQLFLQIIVLLSMSALVVSMYLPIFKMGEAI